MLPNPPPIEAFLVANIVAISSFSLSISTYFPARQKDEKFKSSPEKNENAKTAKVEEFVDIARDIFALNRFHKQEVDAQKKIEAPSP